VTIAFQLPASAAERVGFSYSPAMEAVLSLHVLQEASTDRAAPAASPAAPALD